MFDMDPADKPRDDGAVMVKPRDDRAVTVKPRDNGNIKVKGFTYANSTFFISDSFSCYGCSPDFYKSTIRRFAHAARWPIRSLSDFIYPEHEARTMRRVIAGAFIAPLALAASIIVVAAGIIALLGLVILTPLAFLAALILDAGIKIGTWVTQSKKPVVQEKADTKLFKPVEVDVKKESEYGKTGSYDPRSFPVSEEKAEVVDKENIPPMSLPKFNSVF